MKDRLHRNMKLLQSLIFIVCYFLQPCNFTFFYIGCNNQMSELAVRRSTVPMGYSRRAFYHVSFIKNLSWPAFFLVITNAFSNDQDLPAGVRMPIGPYPWSESYQ